VRTKKRIFIGLMGLSLLFLIGLLAGSYYLLVSPPGWFHRLVLMAGLAILSFLFLILAIGLGGLVLILWQGRSQPFFLFLGTMAVNWLFPLALAWGKLLGIAPEKVKASFIEMNNQLVRLRKVKLSPSEVLLLAPHCLQWSGCPHKITIDVNNCKRCGRCPIHSLHGLAEKYGICWAVATGGTLARHFVKKYRPKGVVAIACERDLTSGIQNVHPLPVIGIINERPQGPCLNTQVDVERVEEALRFFLMPQDEAAKAKSQIGGRLPTVSPQREAWP